MFRKSSEKKIYQKVRLQDLKSWYFVATEWKIYKSPKILKISALFRFSLTNMHHNTRPIYKRIISSCQLWVFLDYSCPVSLALAKEKLERKRATRLVRRIEAHESLLWWKDDRRFKCSTFQWLAINRDCSLHKLSTPSSSD